MIRFSHTKYIFPFSTHQLVRLAEHIEFLIWRIALAMVFVCVSSLIGTYFLCVQQTRFFFSLLGIHSISHDACRIKCNQLICRLWERNKNCGGKLISKKQNCVFYSPRKEKKKLVYSVIGFGWSVNEVIFQFSPLCFDKSFENSPNDFRPVYR